MDGDDSAKNLKEWVQGLPKFGGWTPIPDRLVTKEVLKGLLGTDLHERATRRLNDNSTRQLVIDTMGDIETLCATLLSLRVVEDAADRLFGNRGKIRDSELRIELLYALNLIDKSELIKLHTLRKIRNRFAHDSELHTFEHDEFALGLCRSLPVLYAPGVQKIEVPLRVRFFLASVAITKALHNRCLSGNVVRVGSGAPPVEQRDGTDSEMGAEEQ
jgi:hypothetical protein